MKEGCGQMLFRKDIEPMCEYCGYAGKVSENDMVCRKRGITARGGSCRLFKYDPLKRKPPAAPKLILKGLSDEDFKL
jgi:hypothetical protein